MIAKFPGRCAYCKQPITVGIDTYDLETKKNWHEDCRSSQPPGPEDFRLAGELGFVRHQDATIHAAVLAWSLRQDWLLRPLLTAHRSDSAGRPPAAPPAGSHPTLFNDDDEEESVTA